MPHLDIHDIGRGRRVWRGLAAPAAGGAMSLALLAGQAGAGGDCDADGQPDIAQSYVWRSTLPLGGLWSQQANWQSVDNGVPGPMDLAVFDGNSGLGLPPYTAVLNGFTAVLGLDVVDVDTTIKLQGNQLSVLGLLPGCRELFVGGADGSSLTIEGDGVLSTGLVEIGDGDASALVLAGSGVGGGGTLTMEHLSPSPLVVGTSGEGLLDVPSAVVLHDGVLVVGEQPGSRGEVQVSNVSKLVLGAESGSTFVIGQDGVGVVSFTGGAVLDHGPSVSLGLGLGPEGDGTLSLMTPGVTHSVPVVSAVIGMGGTGLLEIGDSTTVSMLAPNGVAIGDGTDSYGEALVTTGGLWQINGPVLEVGLRGVGNLSLGESGEVSTIGVVRASRDGVVRGSGAIDGSVVLRGGGVRPSAQFAETPARQQLDISGDLFFSSARLGTTVPETGRLIFTLGSDDEDETMSVVVMGHAALAGTMRVRVNASVVPTTGVLYPAVEADQMTGRFAAVQSPALTTGLVAQAVYPGDGTAYVRFDPFEAPEPDLEPPEAFEIFGVFADGKAEDVDGDGFPDLVAVIDNGPGFMGQLLVSRNLGNGTGGQWNGYDPNPQVFPTAGTEPVSLDLGDMNQDQKPDVVVLNAGDTSDQVRILLNDPGGTGDFSTADARTVTIPGTPVDLVVADINGSGLLDIVTVYEPFFLRGSGGGMNTAEDDGGGGFDDSDGDTGDNPGSVDSMGSEAVPNGIASTSKTENAVYTYGTGAAANASAPRGLFPLVPLQRLPAGRDPEDMFTADLNGDGFDEIITSDALSGSISVQLSVSGGTDHVTYGEAVALRASEASDGGQPSSVVSLDVNGDGRRDLAYVASAVDGSRRVFTILNLGPDDSGESMLFSRPVVVDINGVVSSRAVLAVADVDQNGREDLVSLTGFVSSGPGVIVFRSAGSGPCNAADLAAPFGVLDLQDLNDFVTAFLAQSPAADLAPPFGVLDLADLNAFVTLFQGGCP